MSFQILSNLKISEANNFAIRKKSLTLINSIEKLHFLNPDFAHVTMWDTKGIAFRGCEFKNSTLNPRFKLAEIEYGKGIATLDASFTVRDACVGHPICPPGTWVKSKFNNLYIGIDAGISYSSKPFEVYNTEFEDNYYGVYA